MISIGVNGDIIPNVPYRGKNITAIVLSACANVLEAHVLLRMKEATVPALKHAQIQLRHATAQSFAMYELKQDLLDAEPSFSALKDHMLSSHSLSVPKAFGMTDYYNTQAMEHQHVDDGVNAYRKTSKRNSNLSTEMLFHSFRRKIAAKLNYQSQRHDISIGIGRPKVMPLVDDNLLFTARTVTSYKSCPISYDVVKNEYVVLSGTSPLWTGVTMGQLTLQLKEYVIEVKEELWEDFVDTSSLALEHGIFITPDQDTGLDSFHLYTTNSYIPDKPSTGMLISALFRVLNKPYLVH